MVYLFIAFLHIQDGNKTITKVHTEVFLTEKECLDAYNAQSSKYNNSWCSKEAVNVER